jgi:hypothetical protein
VLAGFHALGAQERTEQGKGVLDSRRDGCADALWGSIFGFGA